MKGTLAAMAFAFACVIVTINMFMPPEGAVDSSIVYIFAQLLIFSATLLGVDMVVSEYLKNFKK